MPFKLLFVASSFQVCVLLCESINCCHFLYEQVHLHCINYRETAVQKQCAVYSCSGVHLILPANLEPNFPGKLAGVFEAPFRTLPRDNQLRNLSPTLRDQVGGDWGQSARGAFRNRLREGKVSLSSSVS